MTIFSVTDKRRYSRLAATRTPHDGDSFVAAMKSAGVTEVTARFLWEELEPYYGDSLRPDPVDRPVSQLRMDAADVKVWIEDFWLAMRGKSPFPAAAPLNDDPSLSEIGRWLDGVAGWTAGTRA